MELPILQPQEVRPEENQPQEIWQPHWDCFCCQDTGKIQLHLVKLVMPAYQWNRDRIPVCQNCNQQYELHHLIDLGILDTRFSKSICQKLDKIAREDWKRTTLAQFETRKQLFEDKLIAIAQNANLRSRNRTQEECVLALSNHSKARGDCETIEEEEDNEN